MDQPAVVQFEEFKKDNDTKLDGLLKSFQVVEDELDAKLTQVSNELERDIKQLRVDFQHDTYNMLLGIINARV